MTEPVLKLEAFTNEAAAMIIDWVLDLEDGTGITLTLGERKPEPSTTGDRR